MDHEASYLSEFSPKFKYDQAGQRLERIVMKMPVETRTTLENAALKSDRSWDEQLVYMANVASYRSLPDTDDPMTGDEWRALARTIEVVKDPIEGKA